MTGECFAPGEEWRDIAGYEGLYEVSDLGRVRSLLGQEPRIKVLSKDKDGYPLVLLFGRGKADGRIVHRLVAETFLPDGRSALHCEVGHLDGNRANAAAANLKWVSKVENHSHRRAHGTHPSGEKHPRAKLTEAQVRKIRTRYATSAVIAADFGISRHTVFDIWCGRRWPESFNPFRIGVL